jgi:hypothetical protein
MVCGQCNRHGTWPPSRPPSLHRTVPGLPAGRSRAGLARHRHRHNKHGQGDWDHGWVGLGCWHSGLVVGVCAWVVGLFICLFVCERTAKKRRLVSEWLLFLSIPRSRSGSGSGEVHGLPTPSGVLVQRPGILGSARGAASTTHAGRPRTNGFSCFRFWVRPALPCKARGS